MRTGLKPRSDVELLPVLLDLLAAKTSVAGRPTQMSRQQRTDRARELARALGSVFKDLAKMAR
ncbi:hypothetical protein [Streptomyces sp. NBC_00932]|uniref:hypothetical protein n=1 Tax=Streptomyces sp. NBC_00932 TaxID=2903690 RepID=UPI0038646D1D|nr:hypothetical protein OG221_00810 [Streptomyces sp. NBC_00932]